MKNRNLRTIVEKVTSSHNELFKNGCKAKMVGLRICLRICNQAKIEELFNKGADDDVIKMLPGVSMWWVNKAQFKVGGTLRSWPSNHATKSSGWNLNKQICPLFSFQNNKSFKVSEFSSLISNTATLASKRFLEINKVY